MSVMVERGVLRRQQVTEKKVSSQEQRVYIVMLSCSEEYARYKLIDR